MKELNSSKESITAIQDQIVEQSKDNFSVKNFFSKYKQIRSFRWIRSHLLKKSWMENFIFHAMLFHSFCCWFVKERAFE